MDNHSDYQYREEFLNSFAHRHNIECHFCGEMHTGVSDDEKDGHSIAIHLANKKVEQCGLNRRHHGLKPVGKTQTVESLT